MQPFINPYLFQNPYYSNIGNNTMPNTPNFSNPQVIGISGKYVNDFSEITASDIPMNGQPAVFAKNDKSEIQLREWSPNGQIVTTLYKPYIEPIREEVSNSMPIVQQPLFDAKTEVLEPIFERITALEEKLDKLNKPSSVNRAKKEGE